VRVVRELFVSGKSFFKAIVLDFTFAGDGPPCFGIQISHNECFLR